MHFWYRRCHLSHRQYSIYWVYKDDGLCHMTTNVYNPMNINSHMIALTLLQCRPIPIKKLSGFISRWMKFLLWTYSILFIIWKQKIIIHINYYYTIKKRNPWKVTIVNKQHPDRICHFISTFYGFFLNIFFFFLI